MRGNSACPSPSLPLRRLVDDNSREVEEEEGEGEKADGAADRSAVLSWAVNCPPVAVVAVLLAS